MGKKKEGGEEDEGKKEKEGQNLLGSPRFKKLENGRFKCVETGHEVPDAQSKEAYAQAKHCRLGLIDAALARNKPPLNMFRQDPTSRSKIVCKLTGDTINKTEEHIWKHINGRRFLNMLEKKETEKQTPSAAEQLEETSKSTSKPEADGLKEKKKKKKKKVKDIGKAKSEVMDSSDRGSNLKEEEDFWMPPVGERWDMDDGGDRWGSGSESEPENEVADEADDATDESKDDAEEISRRTKRMSIEIGPSSFASRKKKNKTKST